MKIAQISYNYLPILGGQEIYIKNLIDILSDNSIYSHVFQPDKPSVDKSAKGITRVFYIPFVGKYIKEWNWYIFNLFLFFHTKKLKNFNVIISHYAFHSIPVWNLRERSIILSHGIEWNVDRKNLNDRIHEYIAKKTFDKFTIVANDTYYFRYLGLNIPPASGFFTEVSPGKWFIPNCVDPGVFKKTNGLPELLSKKTILVPRQITEDRGISLAIEAFNIFIKSRPDFNLLIVGGPLRGNYYSYCRNLIAKFGLDEKVTFTGPIANKDMPDIYSSCLLTLIPTLRREGTSLSAIESMACGTPALSTNVAGLQDLPTIKADPVPSDISEKMIYCLENHERISLQQLKIVKSTFTVENWKSAWRMAIQNVVSKMN